MFHLGRALVSAGHTVDVLAVATPKYNPKDIITRQYIQDNYSYKKVLINTDVTFSGALIAFLKNQPYHVSRFVSRQFSEVLVSMLREKEYDVVICETLYMSPYLDVIRNNSGAKCILRSHNIEHLIWKRIASNMNNFPKKTYIRYLSGMIKRYEIQTLPGFDAIACISPAEKDYYKKLLPDCRAEIVPFGIDTENLPDIQFSGNGFYHIGSMDWLPNIEGIQWFLEKVVPILEKKAPDIIVFIAGRNMPSWIHEFRSPVIQIEGEIADATAFAASKSVLIVPLLSGSGIRIKIIEAMSLGKTVISTSIGAEGISAENGKAIILADTPEAFAEAIIQLHNNDAAREVGIHARKLIESQHSYKNMLTAFNQLLDF